MIINKMVNIAFADWWTGFDIRHNFITRALDGSVDYQIVDKYDEVDFVFCSVWKKDCFKYKCPRILFVGENFVPDFNIYDYAIGFEELSFADRYIRYPLYAAYYEDVCFKAEKRGTLTGNESEREFCSFVVSNSIEADPYREGLFEKLSTYKKVASGGRYKNNIGCANGVPNKSEFIGNYKFNIACENVSHPGYCTEKIVEAFAANTIPIYWGDPNVGSYFNTKAFINCHDYCSIDEVLERIVYLDSNPELYMSMLSESVMLDNEYHFERMRKRFMEWLVYILGQKKENAFRRNAYGFNAVYENRMKMYLTKSDSTDYKVGLLKRLAQIKNKL